MKKNLYLLLLFSIFIFFTACENSALKKGNKIKVLATTEEIATLVRAIGGHYVECQVTQNLEEADCIFYNGLGLEDEALTDALQNNPQAHSIGSYIELHRRSDIIYINDKPDPHVWMDPGLWKASLPLITTTLAKQLPEKAKEFHHAERMIDNELEILNAETLAKMRAIPVSHRYLVTIGGGFNYFVRAFFVHEEKMLTKAWQNHLFSVHSFDSFTINQTVNFIAQNNVETIFLTDEFEKNTAELIVEALRKKGISVHVADDPLYGNMKDSGFDSYQDMLRYDVDVMYEVLYDWYDSSVKKILR